MILKGDVSKVALVSVTQEGKSRLCLYVYSSVMIYVFLTWYHELGSESNMIVVFEFLKFRLDFRCWCATCK